MGSEDERKELEEVKIGSKEIFDGKILHLFVDEVKLPNGDTSKREIVAHKGAVCIIPVTADGKVVVERQYRYGVGEILTEIPAGKLDYKNEDRLEAAKRELREETGYTAEEWTNLGEFYPAPAYSGEIITMFMAKGLKPGANELDRDEFIKIEEVPLKELVNDVMAGRIPDAKTQLAILKAARYFE